MRMADADDMAGDKTKASQLIMKRGIMLVSSFYICWSVMVINGFATAVGTQVRRLRPSTYQQPPRT